MSIRNVVNVGRVRRVSAIVVPPNKSLFGLKNSFYKRGVNGTTPIPSEPEDGKFITIYVSRPARYLNICDVCGDNIL